MARRGPTPIAVALPPWSNALLADALLVAHAAFVAFVVLGGALVARWPRIAWWHLPAAAWGVTVEWTGWICPLTPLEDHLRRAAGQAGHAGYAGDFVGHWVQSLLYPPGLTRGMQWALGLAVLAINLAVYGVLLARRRRTTRPRRTTHPGHRASSASRPPPPQ
jgi:hypothetical protein